MTGLPDTAQDRCPTCGSDPNDDTLHRDGCARIDTCGQMGPPWIDPPWHPDPAGPYDIAVSTAHRREVHGVGGAW